MKTDKNESIVVSLSAGAGFGKLLRRVENELRSLVIEKRGTPKAVLLSIRDYVRLAAPEPEVLRVIGEESQRKGADQLTSRQIDQAIKAARGRNPKRGLIPLRLVLDTNVVISAALKPDGLQRTVFPACHHQTGQALCQRRGFGRIPGSTRAPGAENPQGSSPATSATH